MADSLLGSAERPLRVAVVGSGPSGFYAIQALQRIPDAHVRVDLLDRLPTPFGLVRGGVAPDHQSIKSVVKGYSQIASAPEVRFFGNVGLGRDVSADELRAMYDAVIYAVGNEGDRKLGIPGEDLEGVCSATQFVYWYNAHPDYQHCGPTLEHARRAVVVGNGNVAVDVARVLARPPEDLAPTDIGSAALDVLRLSGLREVVMLGRRGAAQAAFTTKELKELTVLPGVDFVVEPDEVATDPVTEAWIAAGGAARGVEQNLEVLRAAAARPAAGHDRRIVCRFLVSPIEFLGDEQGRLRAVRVARNRLVERNGAPHAIPTGETWDLEAQVALKAVGYRGIAIEGVAFDEERGIIPNVEGRVIDQASGAALPGEYVVGWAKRGPSGLIGTNKPDSVATVEKIWEDLGGKVATERSGDLAELLRGRGVRFASWEDWQRLDGVEISRGREVAKVREKIASVDEMLAHIGDGSTS